MGPASTLAGRDRGRSGEGEALWRSVGAGAALQLAGALPERRRRWPEFGGRGRRRGVVLIEELTRQASLDLLARTRLGRLACAQGAQPYVVPSYFTYDARNSHLYSFSTVGRKIDWMRANPLVCVEVDEVVSAQEWVSVIAFGRYEELPDTPEWRSARTFAYKLLQQHAMWREPASVKTIHPGPARPLLPIFYRIHVVQITGHRATPATGGAAWHMAVDDGLGGKPLAAKACPARPEQAQAMARLDTGKAEEPMPGEGPSLPASPAARRTSTRDSTDRPDRRKIATERMATR